MKKIKKLHSVSEVINNVQISSKNESAFTCIQIHQNWEKIIGSYWSKICQPVGYNYPCLIIRVPSSSHMHEVQFQKESIVKKINKYTGFTFVKDIRLMLQ